MSSIFLTNGFDFWIENENGQKKAVKLANKGFIDNLKKEIKSFDNLLLIASSPDDYNKNDEYCALIAKSLSLSGVKFNLVDILDSRNWLFSKSLVKNSDLIILMGGNPVEQINFFESIELREKLKKFDGCIMGISAGSINMASNVYCSEDGDIEKSIYYKGLGLTNINIEPHFDLNDKSRIDNILIPDSRKSPFIAINNDSYIVLKNKSINLFGEGYYFYKGAYKKIEESTFSVSDFGGEI